MCRMTCVNPSLMKKEDILEILSDMEGFRTGDGFGYGYVKNKEFIVKKTILPLKKILKTSSYKDFFGDVWKHDGLVLFHMRKASKGEVSTKNCHPFIGNNHIFTHNGTFKGADLAKFIFGNGVKWKSNTDSEVALNIFEKTNPGHFMDLVDESGVFFALNLDGNLCAIKTNYFGDLRIGKLGSNKVFLSSEIPGTDWKDEMVDPGIMFINKNSEVVKFIKKKEEISIRHGYGSCNPINSHNEFEGYGVRETTVYHGNRKETISRRPVKSIHSMNDKEYIQTMQDESWPWSYASDN